jgi:pimeloyl-ACP methyl ester carboxylesterase
MLADNAGEVGLAWSGPPTAVRRSVPVDGGREVSAVVWGDGDPEIVILHGGGQNAHTWDTVVLALDRSVLAVDLPGHGHSSWRQDGQYEPVGMASEVATAVEALAPRARMVVGMSLGGLTAIALAARRRDLVGRLALVDVAPSIDRDAAAPIGAFIHGPASFATRDEIVERAIAFNPTRSESSLRRGVVHNTRQGDDGRWMWRHHFWAAATSVSSGTISAPYGRRSCSC